MKLAPTVLVLAALGVLLWVSSHKPATGDATGAADAAAHGANGHGAPAGGQDGGTELVRSIPATPLLPPPPRNPNSIIVTVRDPAGLGQGQIDVKLIDASGKQLAQRRSDHGGRAAFDAVAPGTYRVVAYDPDYLYTSRGSAEVVAKKDAVNDVELQVERGTCGLRGTLVDGAQRPLPEHAVLLSAGGAEFSVNTDPKGRFQVNGLVAGDWSVTPVGFPEQKTMVRLADGATAETVLKLARSARIEIEVSGSHLHPAHFHGGEMALVRVVGNSNDAPITRTFELFVEGDHEHANVMKTRFEGLVAGNYELDVVDGKGASLLSPGAAWNKPVPLTLNEGDDRVLPIKTGASARGAGITVPTWAIALMFVVIGGLCVVTPVLFPPPLVAKRPLGIQR